MVCLNTYEGILFVFLFITHFNNHQVRKLFNLVNCVSTSGQLCDNTQGLVCTGICPACTCQCSSGNFFNGTACREFWKKDFLFITILFLNFLAYSLTMKNKTKTFECRLLLAMVRRFVGLGRHYQWLISKNYINTKKKF